MYLRNSASDIHEIQMGPFRNNPISNKNYNFINLWLIYAQIYNKNYILLDHPWYIDRYYLEINYIDI